MRNLHTQVAPTCASMVFSWSHGQQSSAGPMDSSSGGFFHLHGLSKEALDSVTWIIKGSLGFCGIYSVENLIYKDALQCFGTSFILEKC